MSSQPISFFPAAKSAPTSAVKSAWPLDEVAALFDLPFNDLLYRAQHIHRANFNANEVEMATLLSIETGHCPEDCGYCPQAARYDTSVTAPRRTEEALHEYTGLLL
jgi:biotin synthase